MAKTTQQHGVSQSKHAERRGKSGARDGAKLQRDHVTLHMTHKSRKMSFRIPRQHLRNFFPVNRERTKTTFFQHSSQPANLWTSDSNPTKTLPTWRTRRERYVIGPYSQQRSAPLHRRTVSNVHFGQIVDL